MLFIKTVITSKDLLNEEHEITMSGTTQEPPKLNASTPTLNADISRDITPACCTVLSYLIDGNGSAEQTIQQIRTLPREECKATLTESFGLMFGKLADFRETLIRYQQDSKPVATSEAAGTLFQEAAFSGWRREVSTAAHRQIDAIAQRTDQLFKALESDPSLQSLPERAYIHALNSFIDSLPDKYVASGYMQKMLQVAVDWGNKFNSQVVNSHSAGFPLLGREPEATAMLNLFQKARERLSFPDKNEELQKLKEAIKVDGYLIKTLKRIEAGGYNRSSH